MTSNEQNIVNLAAVVVYKAPKEDRFVIEGMTYCDIVTSHAQYIAMLIEKKSAVGRF